jgi:hypothetical protein
LPKRWDSTINFFFPDIGNMDDPLAAFGKSVFGLRIGSETKWYPARRARWASSRPNGYAPIASAP